jgi:hypothetical protein
MATDSVAGKDTVFPAQQLCRGDTGLLADPTGDNAVTTKKPSAPSSGNAVTTEKPSGPSSGNAVTTKKPSAKKRSAPSSGDAATTKFNWLTADLLKFLGIRRFGLAGDLPKKRVARQAIFAAPLPPLVKFGLLHLVEYGDGEPGDPDPYNCMYSPEVDQALVGNKSLIKASVPRAEIQRMRGRAPSEEDPHDPHLEEFSLRATIIGTRLPPLSKLVLLALVEFVGKDVKPLADYTNLSLSPADQGAADRLPAEARLVAKLAKWTGLGVKEVVDTLTSVHTQLRIPAGQVLWDGDLFANWDPNAEPTDKD